MIPSHPASSQASRGRAGNVTGLSDVATTLSTKRLSLLKELLPQLRRVAMLWNKGDRGMSLRYEASAVAARELGVIVQPLGVSEPDDFIEAFDTINRERPDAIFNRLNSLTLLNRRRVFEYAAERRLPAIYETNSLTREGGLMSYGPDRREIFERSAALVDRIFKGAKPADLPVEQPTRFLFVLNLNTAKALGLTVPNTLLATADEVIGWYRPDVESGTKLPMRHVGSSVANGGKADEICSG